MLYADPNHCPSTLISGSLLDLLDHWRHTSTIVSVLRLISLSQVPQPCIFRSHLQSRPDTGSAAYADPIQARQRQFTVRQGFCMILVFGFMTSTSVLLFLSPIFLRDLSNVLFLVINCIFRTSENKWSALRCSLWKGKILSLERLHQIKVQMSPMPITAPLKRLDPRNRLHLRYDTICSVNKVYSTETVYSGFSISPRYSFSHLLTCPAGKPRLCMRALSLVVPEH